MGKYIRNDVKRKYLKIPSKIYGDSCIVKPLPKIVTDAMKFKLTLWF